jgi:hypothetical protein
VVLEVLADPRQVDSALDAMLLQLFFRSEARSHQDGWATVSPGGNDNLLLGLVLNLLASFGDSGYACCTRLARVAREEDLVDYHFGFDGDVRSLVALGDEVCRRSSNSLVYRAWNITTSIRCLPGREHVGTVRKPNIDHTFLDAFRDGRKVVWLDVQRTRGSVDGHVCLVPILLVHSFRLSGSV